MTKTTISLSQLNAVKASEAEFGFPFLLDGEETGITFLVIGGQAKRLTSALTELVNGQRKRAAVAEMKAKTGGRKEEPVFQPFEEDIDYSNRSAALRLVGWTGITETFSADLALELCSNNADVRTQVVTNSDNMANFMQGLLKTS
jgi:hypothetical protein